MRGTDVTDFIQAHYTGTNLSKTDVNLVVKITGWDSRNGPEVEKVATGAGATDQLGLGAVQIVESRGTTRSPAPFGGVTIGNGTRVYVKKSRGNPAPGDVGQMAIFDVSTTGNPIAGGVIPSSSATSGFGVIVDITGTTADDFLVVNTKIRTK